MRNFSNTKAPAIELWDNRCAISEGVLLLILETFNLQKSAGNMGFIALNGQFQLLHLIAEKLPGYIAINADYLNFWKWKVFRKLSSGIVNAVKKIKI